MTPSKGSISKFLDKCISSVVWGNRAVSCSKIQCTLECSEIIMSVSSIHNPKPRARLLHVCCVEKNLGLTPVVYTFFQTNMQTDNKTICFISDIKDENA